MQQELLLFIVLTAGFGIIIFLLNRKLTDLKKQDPNQALLEWLKTMQASLETTNKTLNDALSNNSTTMIKTLQENSKQLNERLDRAAAVIKDVGHEVGQMSEIGRSMRDLQEFLRSPKMRGHIGEEVLTDLISQIFPKNSFHLQYQFKSGDKVDAAIRTDAGILPIDSKFPMENFQRMMKAETDGEKENCRREFARDIKRHIDAISKKYILPEEGTMDFALMYVPSESVYYEIVNLSDVLTYARKSRVYCVSPSTLYAHLQTILLSFEGKKIEVRSREVFRMLRALQLDYDKVQENLTVLGKHLTNASSQFANVTTGYMQLGQKISSVKTLDGKETEEQGKKELH